MDILSETARHDGDATASVADREGAVRALAWANELEPRHIALLSSISMTQSYEPGDIAVNDPRTAHAQIVVGGAVEILRAGQKLVVLRSGELWWPNSDLAPRADNPTTARVLEHTTTLAVAPELMQQVLAESPAMMREVLAMMSNSMLSIRRRLGPSGGLRTAPAEARVDHFEPDLALGDRIRFLFRALPFARQNVEALADLARIARYGTMQDGERLWEEGADEGDAFVLVQRGRVVGRSSEGDQHFAFGPGDVVGLLDAMAARPRWFSAHADGAVTLFHFTATNFVEVLQGHFALVGMLAQATGAGTIDAYDEQAAGQTAGTAHLLGRTFS